MNASDNPKITNVNHLANLEILLARNDMGVNDICGINDAGIAQCIKSESLDVPNNSKIKNVNHLVKLEILDASGACGINDAGLVQCINLRSLDAAHNTKSQKIDKKTT